jgi:hypothetical protein
MAGAGYKLFNTGDVLTAAQVNTYLMEQTVMVFADASARTTALTGVVAEGMISFLKDTNSTEYYSGSAWVAIGGSVPESYGLSAGKNVLINGAMENWQRGTSSTSTSVYLADRWYQSIEGSTAATVSQSTSNIPSDFRYSMRMQRTSGNTGTGGIGIGQSLETTASIPLQGETVVLSFYLRAGANFSASSGTVNTRIFTGTGTDQSQATAYGSWTGYAETSGTATATTSWARYSVTATIPSSATQVGVRIFWTPSGTAGADDSLYITGIQLELGSTATRFSRAGGTLQGELAACQRYYYRATFTTSASRLGSGFATAQVTAHITFPFPTEMRIRPTALEQSGTAGDYSIVSGASTFVCDNVPTFLNATFYAAVASFSVPAASLTVGNGAGLRNVNTNAYLGWSSEL